jgi:cytochrome b561/polyisoprenoid-binding protein YceI
MTPSQYSNTAKLLHWAIALAIGFQISLGFRLEELDKGAAQFWGYQMHKSVGITILMLSLIRVVIRFVHPRPALPVDSPWAQFLAKAVHFLLYAVMLGGPLTGWIVISTGKVKFPTLLFGVVPWPHLPLPQSFHEPGEILHTILALTAIGLLLLHVAGALRHQLVKDENILGRMVPGLGGTRISHGKAVLGVVVGLAAIIGAVAWAKLIPAPTNAMPPPAALPQADPDGDGDATPATDNVVAPKPPETDALPKPDDKSAQAELPTVAAPMALASWHIAKGGQLGFATTWSGTPVHGHFGRWDADVEFSPDVLDKSTVQVTVDLASVNTADGQRDEMLKSDTFFDLAAHPNAIFTTKRITHTGGDHYTAAGTLNLHGQTRPVTLSFTLKIDKGVAHVAGSTRLNRTSFGVGSGDYAATDQIPDPVSISFSFTAKS